MILFRSAWDYIPIPILKLIKYVPADPFTRLRNVNNLFRQYGKQILREQGPEVDAERNVSGKDVMSILGESSGHPLPHAAIFFRIQGLTR